MDALLTERLRLIPLSAAQLDLAAEDWQALESLLGLAPGAYTLSAAERRAIESKRRKLAADPQQLGWTTYWLLVEQESGRAVGLCGFKGAPVAGEVEVGYGTFPHFRGRGYMTEALARLLLWAEGAAPAVQVLAETARNNRASRRVLEKAGFARLRERESENTVWWIYP